MAQSSNLVIALCIFGEKKTLKNHMAFKYPLVVSCIHLPSSEVNNSSDEALYPVVVSVKYVD